MTHQRYLISILWAGVAAGSAMAAAPTRKPDMVISARHPFATDTRTGLGYSLNATNLEDFATTNGEPNGFVGLDRNAPSKSIIIMLQKRTGRRPVFECKISIGGKATISTQLAVPGQTTAVQTSTFSGDIILNVEGTGLSDGSQPASLEIRLTDKVSFALDSCKVWLLKS